MPILYLIGFLTFLIQFWVYKYLLIRFYRKTVSFDQELPFFTIYYFRIGVLMHCILSLFIFTEKNLISARYSNFENIPLGWTTYSEVLEGSPFDRFSQGVGILFITFLFFLILQYVFREPIVKVLKIVVPKVYKYLCCCLH